MSVQKLAAVRNELNARFAERSAPIDGCLLALLAGEHVLLLGPPGTAKSMLARSVAEATHSRFFQYLLTKFTTPEELFGPVSFKGLKEDRFERVIDGHLFDAEIVFLDEIWKAGSSILNTLLTALNEGVAFNGGKVIQIRLRMCMGCSNEYPEDPSLDALYDRFLLRFWVGYVSDRDAMTRLLVDGMSKIMTTLTSDDLDSLRKSVDGLPFGTGEAETMLNIKAALEAEGFRSSDRTWVKVRRIVQAKAVLEGRDHIESSDFLVLADVLWKEHKDRDRLASIIGNTADPYGSRAEAIIDAARTAAHDLPDISLLSNGQKTKAELTNAIAEVTGKLDALMDRVNDVEQDATGNPAVARARKQVEKSQKAAEELAIAVIRWRE